MKDNTNCHSHCLIGGTFVLLFIVHVPSQFSVMSLGPLDLSECEYNRKDTKNREGNIRHPHTPGGADNYSRPSTPGYWHVSVILEVDIVLLLCEWLNGCIWLLFGDFWNITTLSF